MSLLVPLFPRGVGISATIRATNNKERFDPMRRNAILLVMLIALAAAGCSSSAKTEPSTGSRPGVSTTTIGPEIGDPAAADCAEIARRNAAQAKWDAGVAVWSKLSQAERDRYNDPAPGDPGGGYEAWAAAHHFPTVNPNYGTIHTDACP